MFTEADAKEAIQEVTKKYGTATAQTVEKMMRLETAHFTSMQYRLTGTAGMEIGKWGKSVPNAGTVQMKEGGTGIKKTFLVWNPKNFALFLADYITRYNGNFARWNSLQPDTQKEYANRVSKIKSRFV